MKNMEKEKQAERVVMGVISFLCINASEHICGVPACVCSLASVSLVSPAQEQAGGHDGHTGDRGVYKVYSIAKVSCVKSPIRVNRTTPLIPQYLNYSLAPV